MSGLSCSLWYLESIPLGFRDSFPPVRKVVYRLTDHFHFGGSTSRISKIIQMANQSLTLSNVLLAGAPVVFQDLEVHQSGLAQTGAQTWREHQSNLKCSMLFHLLFPPELDLLSCEQRACEQEAWRKLSARGCSRGINLLQEI